MLEAPSCFGQLSWSIWGKTPKCQEFDLGARCVNPLAVRIDLLTQKSPQVLATAKELKLLQSHTELTT